MGKYALVAGWLVLSGTALARSEPDDAGEAALPADAPVVTEVGSPNELPFLISHGPRNSKKVALTFDACSTKDAVRFDPRIADILLNTQTPATLFMGGKWIEAEQETTRFLAAQPQFELALHTHTHPHMTKLSDEKVIAELEANQRALVAVTGKPARFWRPPFGDVDARVAKLAKQVGLITIMYDLPSGDPDGHISAESMLTWIEEKALGGTIVVMHINGRGVNTAEALPGVIEMLRTRGYELVTLGDLIAGQAAVALGPTPGEAQGARVFQYTSSATLGSTNAGKAPMRR
jgi:peptidoglycan/xylan/chitin deacetylase (PgdA/CDA1 family)